MKDILENKIMDSRKDLHLGDRGLVTMESLLTQVLLISRCLRDLTLLFLYVLKIDIKLVNLSVV